MTHFLSTGTPRPSTGLFRGDRRQGRSRRRLAAAAMRGQQVNALNSAARQRAKAPGVSFAFFAARICDRRQFRPTTAQEMLQEQRGATAIEMALCLPVLLLLIIGLLQLGTVMLMQALFHTAMKSVTVAVLDHKDHTETTEVFCKEISGRVQLLQCKTEGGIQSYAIDVRSNVGETEFSRLKPTPVKFSKIVKASAATGTSPATPLGSVLFIRAYMELPVFWSAFTPVFSKGGKIPLYAASAVVYPPLSKTVATGTGTP